MKVSLNTSRKIEEALIPFEEKMEKLTTELSELFDESKTLEENIRANFKDLGYDA